MAEEEGSRRGGAERRAGRGPGPAVLAMAAAGAGAVSGGLAGMSARPLGAAEPLALGSLLGKVVLVSNVASL